MKMAMLSIHSSPIGELGTKDTGGMSVYIRELARELGRHGHWVDIYTRFNEKNHNTVSNLYKNVRLIFLKSGNTGHIPKQALYAHLTGFSQALEKFTKHQALHYDLIHSHYWLSGRLGDLAQSRWKIPHILMFHTLGAVKNSMGVGKPESELRITHERKLAKSCNRILAPTEREKEHLMQYYDALPDQIGVVPCGVNLDLFHPMDKAAARRQLGFGPDESIVLYVGRFDPLKGIDRLLSAMVHLQHRQRLRLVIIGGDRHQTPEAEKLQKLSRKFGIKDAVTFAGRIDQENLPPYYNAADVLAVPSYYESFGLVGLESLSCGTPVVATRVGVLESILREGETGHVVKNACSRSLAEGIDALISNSHTRRLSAHKIRTSVLKFSWSKVASAVLDEYLTVFCHQSGRNKSAHSPFSNQT